MNKAVLLLLLGFMCLASAQYCWNTQRSCVNPAASPAAPCGSTPSVQAMCPVGYTCANQTSGQINGVCVPMLGLGDHGCRPGGPWGAPIECYSESLDLECNDTSGYCVITPHPLGVGDYGCQENGCAGQLYCFVNESYPDESSPQAWYCARINASVGASCQGDYQCAGSYLCNYDSQICYERYSKPVGDDCEYFYECQPGLACKGGFCQYVASSNFHCNSTGSGPFGCQVQDESCNCPSGWTGGEQATCQTEWGPTVTSDYANAEIALLDCMWANCAQVDTYDECPTCSPQLCAYYDQLAINEQALPRDDPLFLCGQVQAEINDFKCKLDPNHIAEVCKNVAVAGTTGVSGNAGNTGGSNEDSSAVSISATVLSVVFVVISLLL